MTEYPVILDITTRRGREEAREVWTGVHVPDLTPAQIESARKAGYERDVDRFIGRDPRRMTQDELRAMGHVPMSLSQAIRAKCIDCCAGSADEVRKCVAMACPSWPYRMGKSPWRAPPSEAQREAARRNAARLHGKPSDPGSLPGDDEDSA